MTSSTACLSASEAVPLLHALVDRLAADSGIRVLFIKGPILGQQGLRLPHASVDADVLVEPGRLGDLLSGLAEIGWTVPVVPTAAAVLPLHSSTLRHRSWPCELDVHDRFPGFLAAPAETFEVLWAHRTVAPLAGRAVPCPDLVAHAAIAALHWLRDGRSPATDARLDELATALRQRLASDDRRALATLAVQTGAVEPLQPLLDRLDLHPPATSHDATAWRIRVASAQVKSVGWVMELGRTPLRLWPRLLTHAVLLTEAEIRKSQPEAAPGAWGLVQARLRRAGRGVRDLPRAVSIVRTEQARP